MKQIKSQEWASKKINLKVRGGKTKENDQQSIKCRDPFWYKVRANNLNLSEN